MTNIKSYELAEKINQILKKIESDPDLKKDFLKDPKKCLANFHVNIPNAEIIVEDHPGYSLYFSIKQKSNTENSPLDIERSDDKTFREYPFSECQNY
ncbi:MAG: hypothetical protein JSS53_05960 [Proteobacteria bacterium]|nr:hypothetical protein [Pseudomonadota bacterium]